MSRDNSLKDSSEEVGSILGRIPGGLFVVTWQENGVDKTMLTSWLMQAGFNPPAISIAVGNGRHFLSAVLSGDFHFVVNVLSENQRRLLGRFGKPPVVEDEPFAGIDIKRVSCGAGVLPGVVGWMECKARPAFLSSDTDQYRGDHSIVIADICAGEINSTETPIVHLRKSGLHY
ncbi:MAG: flavin reductase family protein [Pirellulales bacterium]|nr:flavin reductase family protein [Pirellulales bacterium]